MVQNKGQNYNDSTPFCLQDVYQKWYFYPE